MYAIIIEKIIKKET